MSDFFSFRNLVSITLIKILYAAGMVVITSSGLFQIAHTLYLFLEERSSARPGIAVLVIPPGFAIVMSLFVIIFGNLLWRVLCEAGIVLFSTHDMLASIEEALVPEDSSTVV